MTKDTSSVLFWGYHPLSGYQNFMTYKEKLFVPMDVEGYTYLTASGKQEPFWKSPAATNAINLCPTSLSHQKPGGTYLAFQVDITLARQTRQDIRFRSLDELKEDSCLSMLHRDANLGLWAGIAFIDAHIVK